MKSYIIVEGEDAGEVAIAVQDYMDEGYIPAGGIAIKVYETTTTFFQAVYLPQ